MFGNYRNYLVYLLPLYILRSWYLYKHLWPIKCNLFFKRKTPKTVILTITVYHRFTNQFISFRLLKWLIVSNNNVLQHIVILTKKPPPLYSNKRYFFHLFKKAQPISLHPILCYLQWNDRKTRVFDHTALNMGTEHGSFGCHWIWLVMTSRLSSEDSKCVGMSSYSGYC